MKISVIIPSRGCRYLKYILTTLKEQTIRPYEVILVLKDCDSNVVKKICDSYNLRCVIIEQKKGFFTSALNMGKRAASGDILLFTDEDAIAPKKWVEKYVDLHLLYRDIAGISSRDIYVSLRGKNLRLMPTPDDKLHVRLYRWIARPLIERPHPLFKKYRLGVYITKSITVAVGPYIPSRSCYSLPFRGVNMSFKREYMHDVWFPEHNLLRRAPGNEQFVGIQLVLNGFDTIYVPSNPILHIARESLSRVSNKDVKEAKIEVNLMRSFYVSLLRKGF